MEQIYSKGELNYLVYKGSISNNMYSVEKDNIFILMKDKSIVDIANVSEQWNLHKFSTPIVKHFIVYPKQR